MLETLVALITAVLLAAPTGQSVEITNTFTRDGDGIHQEYQVLLDGKSWGNGHLDMDCSTPTREVICDATEQAPNLVVRYRIHRGDDREIKVETLILVGEARTSPATTIRCTGITTNALCDAFDRLPY